MSQALALVKRDLGDDAMILHTRTFRRGGLLGMGAKSVVEITASNDAAVAPRRRPSRRRESDGESSAARLLARAYGQAEASPHRAAPVEAASTPAAVSDASAVATLPPSAAATAPVDDPQLTRELKQIRQMVGAMLSDPGRATRTDLPEPLFQQYLNLLEQEVSVELADEVVNKVKKRLTKAQMQDERCVSDAVSAAIARLIPIDAHPSAPQRPKDGRPFTLALIGPTGVGKTTTLAKLAATFKLKHRLKVELITIDTYRIAAVDQLKTYANIIDLPLHVVLTPLELQQALGRCRDADVVLIDTAGRSQRDRQKLGELQAFVEAADPHEVHLVLAGTGSQKVLLEAVEHFAPIRTDRVIFTKLDETVSFGVLLNVARRVNKRLSYVTTGQDVPRHIEPGQARRLAELIVEGKL